MDQFVVVRFNPWWFSGRVDIAAAFFEQLRAVFMSWPGRGETERSHLARLAHVVGAATSDEIVDSADLGIDGTPATVPDLKRELSRALADQDKRLLVIIDDIDRLMQDEVAERFAVVKALADFPNTLRALLVGSFSAWEECELVEVDGLAAGAAVAVPAGEQWLQKQHCLGQG